MMKVVIEVATRDRGVMMVALSEEAVMTTTSVLKVAVTLGQRHQGLLLAMHGVQVPLEEMKLGEPTLSLQPVVRRIRMQEEMHGVQMPMLKKLLTHGVLNLPTTTLSRQRGPLQTMRTTTKAEELGVVNPQVVAGNDPDTWHAPSTMSLYVILMLIAAELIILVLHSQLSHMGFWGLIWASRACFWAFGSVSDT